MNNPQNQSYWFVLRDDQNVIFTSNNPIIQNTHVGGQEARYIIDRGERPFIASNEPCEDISVQEAPSHTPAPVYSEADLKQRDNFWDRSKIKLLLTLCLENNFKNATKDKGLLDDIAAHLGTAPHECCIKYKNLRRTFLRLLKKRRQGKEIKWVHYNICEKVFNEYKSLPSSLLEPWDDYKVRNLLNLYIENLDRFRGSDCLQKDIWKEMAAHVGTTHSSCYHKYKNLKRTYFNLMQRSRETGKPVKWPYNHYFERIYYDYTPHMAPWDRTKTRTLMDAYLQMQDKFKDSRYQKKELWKEISVIVNESPHNCDKKFRNLKQTYLKLKLRASSGGSSTKWRYYKDFEAIYSSQHWDPVTLKCQGDARVKRLLQFYVDNKHKFNDPRTTNKHVWRLLASNIGLSSDECDRKFRNLKQTYMRLVDKNNCDNATKWPYYQYFEDIFGKTETYSSTSSHRKRNINVDTGSDLTRMMQQIQDRKHDDKFEKLITAIAESNNIQKERNSILQTLLDKYQ